MNCVKNPFNLPYCVRCAYIHGKSELHRIAYTFGTFHLPAGSPIWYRFCQGDFRLPASSRAKIDPYMRMHMGADPHGCHEEHPYMRRHDLEHIRRRRSCPEHEHPTGATMSQHHPLIHGCYARILPHFRHFATITA